MYPRREFGIVEWNQRCFKNGWTAQPAYFQVLHPLQKEQILESKIAEIDAIRQKRGIDLHINIQLRNIHGIIVAEVIELYLDVLYLY